MHQKVLIPVVYAFLTVLGLAACSPASISSQSELANACGTPALSLANLSAHSGHTVDLEVTISGNFMGADRLSGAFAENSTGVVFLRQNSIFDSAHEGATLRLQGEIATYRGHYKLTDIQAVALCSVENQITTPAIAFPLSADRSLQELLFQRVRLESPLSVIGNYQLARFGTLDIASERLWVPTQVVLPGPAAEALAAQNDARRFILDDGSDIEYPEHVRYPYPGLHIHNPVRAGDQVENLEGFFMLQGQNYHFHPVIEPAFIPKNPRPAPPQLTDGDLRIVAFNVLNYFNGDGQGSGFPTPRGAKTPEEFARQRIRTINTILALDADIYTLMEMENDGFTAHSALADLTRGLNKATAEGTYAFIRADADRIGTDAITQAIIYRSDRVSPEGNVAWTTEGAFAWGSRPPLAQNFRVHSSGKSVAVVANHFKSKGGCPREADHVNANQGDGQACWNHLRTETAAELVHWLHSNPLNISHENYVLLGDFNAYAQEDPLRVLAAAGFPNLATTFAPTGYSYVFRGQKGSLDHALVHENIVHAVTGFAHWHVNADEPIAFEYPIAGKTTEQQQDWYSPEPFRASDHDPIILMIDTRRLQ